MVNTMGGSSRKGKEVASSSQAERQRGEKTTEEATQRFPEQKWESVFKRLEGKSIITEAGVVDGASKILNLLPRVEGFSWRKLIAIPAPRSIISEIVREAYLNIRIMLEKEKGTFFCRGIEIPFSVDVIAKYFDLPRVTHSSSPFYEWRDSEDSWKDIIPLLCPDPRPGVATAHPHAIWDRRGGKPRTLKVKWLSVKATILFKFIHRMIIPSTHNGTIKLEEAQLIFAIIKKWPIDLAEIIYNEIIVMANDNRKKGLGFPSFITSICLREGVKKGKSYTVLPQEPALTNAIYDEAEKAARNEIKALVEGVKNQQQQSARNEGQSDEDSTPLAQRPKHTHGASSTSQEASHEPSLPHFYSEYRAGHQRLAGILERNAEMFRQLEESQIQINRAIRRQGRDTRYNNRRLDQWIAHSGNRTDVARSPDTTEATTDPPLSSQ